MRGAESLSDATACELKNYGCHVRLRDTPEVRADNQPHTSSHEETTGCMGTVLLWLIACFFLSALGIGEPKWL